MSDRYAGYHRLKLDTPAPRILQVTLDTPGRLNAADATMHGELARIWRDVDSDPDVSCVMIRGAGKAFSAGGDLDMIDEMIHDHHTLVRVWKEARDMVYALINCSKPVVSAMHGPAVGAGLVCGILADVSIADRAHHRRPHPARRCRRRSLGDHLAAAVRHGEGQILPSYLRAADRRGGRAHRPDLALRRRRRAVRQGAGSGPKARRRAA
jgi:hypothetical protein